MLFDALIAVDANANDAWKNAADQIIINLAKRNRVFTSDDIWEGLSLAGVHTAEHRAMGPRIIAAVKAGVIEYQTCDHCETTKVVTKSRREESHGKFTTVYSSIIYGQVIA
jgi:hypothetical protein